MRRIQEREFPSSHHAIVNRPRGINTSCGGRILLW